MNDCKQLSYCFPDKPSKLAVAMVLAQVLNKMSLLVKNNSLTKGMVHHKYNNRIQLICVTQVELLVLKSQEMEYIYETEIC